MSEPQKAGGNPRRSRWRSHAVTLLLLVAVLATGTVAYHAREQWWQRYLSFIQR